MCLHFKCVDIVRLLLILEKCDIVLANYERWYWYGRIENIHRQGSCRLASSQQDDYKQIYQGRKAKECQAGKYAQDC